LHLANRWPPSGIKRIASARERGGSDAMQVLGIDADTLAGPFERTLKVSLLLQ
jgi:hypothetical protein